MIARKIGFLILVVIGLGFLGALFAFDGTSQESTNPAQKLTQVDNIESVLERRAPGSREEVLLSFAPVVKQVAPAVVNIYTKKVVQVQASPFFNDPFFRRFFGENTPFGVPRERVQGSLGSGVIVRADGIIVTNNHVIGDADEIRVVLADRREYDAEVVLADPRTDLAVLKIDAGEDSLPTLNFLDSDQVQVGDISLAIGNPFGVGQTVTSGIVSATARTNAGISDFQFFIQTDAAVNPGNSGGALVGLDGRLIGINTAIYTRTGENNGIGFAIPSNMVKTVVDAALAGGAIVRPWIGFTGQSVDSQIAQSLGLVRPGGVLVDNVYPSGPADMAGIEPGDIILEVDGKEIIDTPGLHFRIATAGEGAEVPFRINRGGEIFEVPVLLTLPPENPPRNETKLEGRNPFQEVTIANLSPRLADEVGFDIMETGVIVLEVDLASPAGRRNFIRPGDIILSLNGQPIDRVADVEAALAQPSDDYIYELKRAGRRIECGIIGGRSFYCREG